MRDVIYWIDKGGQLQGPKTEAVVQEAYRVHFMHSKTKIWFREKTETPPELDDPGFFTLERLRHVNGNAAPFTWSPRLEGRPGLEEEVASLKRKVRDLEKVVYDLLNRSSTPASGTTSTQAATSSVTSMVPQPQHYGKMADSASLVTAFVHSHPSQLVDRATATAAADATASRAARAHTQIPTAASNGSDIPPGFAAATVAPADSLNAVAPPSGSRPSKSGSALSVAVPAEILTAVASSVGTHADRATLVDESCDIEFYMLTMRYRLDPEELQSIFKGENGLSPSQNFHLLISRSAQDSLVPSFEVIDAFLVAVAEWLDIPFEELEKLMTEGSTGYNQWISPAQYHILLVERMEQLELQAGEYNLAAALPTPATLRADEHDHSYHQGSRPSKTSSDLSADVSRVTAATATLSLGAQDNRSACGVSASSDIDLEKLAEQCRFDRDELQSMLKGETGLTPAQTFQFLIARKKQVELQKKDEEAERVLGSSAHAALKRKNNQGSQVSLAPSSDEIDAFLLAAAVWMKISLKELKRLMTEGTNLLSPVQYHILLVDRMKKLEQEAAEAELNSALTTTAPPRADEHDRSDHQGSDIPPGFEPATVPAASLTPVAQSPEELNSALPTSAPLSSNEETDEHDHQEVADPALPPGFDATTTLAAALKMTVQELLGMFEGKEGMSRDELYAILMARKAQVEREEQESQQQE